MALTKFTAYTSAKASEVNANISDVFNMVGKNHIRQLFDRAGVYSAGEDDGWGEAYVDADGRNDSVDTDVGDTTATFVTDEYQYSWGSSTGYFMDVHATSSTDTNSSYASVKQVASGVWRVWANETSIVLSRAKVLAHLFGDTDGDGSGAALYANYASVTAVKVSESDDVGKRASWSRIADTDLDANIITFLATVII